MKRISLILFFSEQFASLLAAIGSLISVILVLIFVPYVPKQNPDIKVDKKSDAAVDEQKAESVLNFRKIFGLIFAPGVTILLLIKLVSGVPIGIIQSMFSGLRYFHKLFCPCVYPPFHTVPIQ